MSVERNLPLVRERRQAILAGDPERAKAQRDAGKLTARERVNLLLDGASFVELDALAGCAGVITGYGMVDDRPVYVYAQDFTVKAGAVGKAHAGKVLKVYELAEKTGAPVIALLDSAGARLDEGMEGVNAYARIMARASDLSGVVPQVSVVLGPCAGGAAMCASLSDVVIIGKSGSLFVNGPQLVAGATGGEVDLEKLAGAKASAASGAAHLACESDESAIAAARKLIGLLPGNNLEDSPYPLEDEDDAGRALSELNAIDSVGDIKDIIAKVADHGDVTELSGAYAPEMVTALARIGGSTVGFVGNQPGANEGRLTIKGTAKAARFVRFCDCFSIPVVSFVDTAGAVVDGQPQGELMSACARLMYAYTEATSPRISVVTGNAIGTGAAAMASRAAADVIYAWPGSVISPMGAPAAVQLLYKSELHAAQDPVAKRAELEQRYADEVADGINAAKSGMIDDVIEPADTRKMLAAALEMLAGKRDSKPAKKHGNMPL